MNIVQYYYLISTNESIIYTITRALNNYGPLSHDKKIKTRFSRHTALH